MFKKIGLGFAVVFIFLSFACAQVPHLINYQGRLTDKTGKPLEGAYDVTFKIYDAETGPGQMAPWEEKHQGMVIQKGIFSVLLGSVTNLDLPFDKPYFLEIKVGDEVMSPRQRIASVGYAIRSEKAEKIQNYKPDELLDRKNHTGIQLPNTISPQGTNSGLDADTIDGKHLSEIASGVGEMGFCFGYQVAGASSVSAKFKKVKGLNNIRVNFTSSGGEGCVGNCVTFSCGDIKTTINNPGGGIILDISSLEDNKSYTINGSIGGVGAWGSSCGRVVFGQVIFTHE